MFGLPENETAPLSEMNMPEPDPYVIPEYKLLDKKHSYVYDVYLLQQRLIELGWLDGTADGVYGDDTYMAVGYFQKAIGMQPTATPRRRRRRRSTGTTPRAPTTAAPPSARPRPHPRRRPRRLPRPRPRPYTTTAPRNAAPTVAVDLTLFD